MILTLDEAARYAGGRLEGARRAEVRGYSIDSRTIRSGELFIAIRGPRFDGHAFVAEAAARGAAGAVVSGDVSPEPGLPLIRVGATLESLHALARAVRRRWGGPLIGVTGSIGKTTTKEMIAAVLGRRGRVLRSKGNLNNAYGLPLCLLGLEPHHDVAVVEMGMSAGGEIRSLASIAEPNEGVITNVHPVHLEFFASVDAIADAKAELLDGLVGESRAYLNNDDARVRGMASRFAGEIVTWGVGPEAAFRACRIEDRGTEGTSFTVRHRNHEADFVLPLLGTHNVRNAIASISVGVTHGIGWRDAAEAMKSMRPAAMRGSVVKFREGFSLIDDSYNSNPRALGDMIRLLGSMRGYRRRILVAGGMLELGQDGRRLHAGCGRDAVEAGVDLIIGVGSEAEALVDGARDAGADPARLRRARDAVEAGGLLAEEVRRGDLILLKGSRGIKLERTLDALRGAFSTVES